MKFTKENVVKVVDDYFCQADFEPCTDLIAEINNLDDTTEKVEVPKFVADWIKCNKLMGVHLQTMINCYKHYYYNRNPNCQTDGEKAVQWYVDNPYKFIQAYEEGYTTTTI